MKKYYLFIALAMVAAMSVSCKNNKKAEANEADAEVVEAAKTILADDVLATIDEIGKTYIDESGKIDVQKAIASSLTEDEKLIKPDYLLDPAQANDFVTKSQKVAGLAILVTESFVRDAYGMPKDECNEAIARLIADLNDPLSSDDNDLPFVERVKKSYEQCKENGELAYFWHLMFAFQTEYRYLVANNPEPFFRNITEEQYSAFHDRMHTAIKAIETIAEYDAEVKEAWDAFNAAAAFDNSEEAAKMHETIETAKIDFAARKEEFAARRAALLK